MKPKIPFFLLFASLIFSFSCSKDDRKSFFQTNMVAPIAHTSLDLSNIADGYIESDPNGLLSMVYEFPLHKTSIADFFIVPDTQTFAGASLQTLELADQNIQQAVPLFVVYAPALALNGQTAQIPAQSISNLVNLPLDASDIFRSATFVDGFLDITISNGFPVTLSRMIFELRNAADNRLVAIDTFNNIQPGTSQIRTASLAGKTLYGQMLANAILIETAASNGPVLINSGALTIITVTARDMSPSTAIARFPTQDVYNTGQVVTYDFGGPEIKKMKVRSGLLDVEMYSTVQEQITALFEIPHAVKDGQSFSLKNIAPAASPGGVVKINKAYDISGYTIDLRGKNPDIDNVFNTFLSNIILRIDSSGNETEITLNDSFYIIYTLKDVVPEWIEGYMGQTTIEIGPDTAGFDLFKQVKGNFDLKDVSLDMIIKNGFGIQAGFDFKRLEAKLANGSNEKLNTQVLANRINVVPATFPPLIPSVQRIPITYQNSNLKTILEGKPSSFNYYTQVHVNPSGNIRNYQDFVTYESEFEVSVEARIPASLKADNLHLADTVDIDFNALAKTPGVKQTTFNLLVDNGFPFEVTLQVFLLDGNGKIIDSLVSVPNNKALPGRINPQTQRVTEKTFSVVKAIAGPDKKASMLDSKRAIIQAVVNTPQGANHWNLYSSYNVAITLTADVIYEQGY
jgi:hypothetical protein